MVRAGIIKIKKVFFKKKKKGLQYISYNVTTTMAFEYVQAALFILGFANPKVLVVKVISSKCLHPPERIHCGVSCHPDVRNTTKGSIRNQIRGYAVNQPGQARGCASDEHIGR